MRCELLLPSEKEQPSTCGAAHQLLSLQHWIPRREEPPYPPLLVQTLIHRQHTLQAPPSLPQSVSQGHVNPLGIQERTREMLHPLLSAHVFPLKGNFLLSVHYTLLNAIAPAEQMDSLTSAKPRPTNDTTASLYVLVSLWYSSSLYGSPFPYDLIKPLNFEKESVSCTSTHPPRPTFFDRSSNSFDTVHELWSVSRRQTSTSP